MTNQAIKASLYLFNCFWRKRYLILLPIILMPIVGLVIGKLAPKNYIVSNSIIIQSSSKLNPFLHNDHAPKKIEFREQALNTLLHTHETLSVIANKSGLIETDMPKDKQEEIIDGLIKNLTATIVSEDTIRLSYIDKDKSRMNTVMHTAVSVFIKQLQPSIRNLEGDLSQKENILQKLNTDIATTSSRYAALQARYTNNHSQIRNAEKELQALKERRDNLLQFEPTNKLGNNSIFLIAVDQTLKPKLYKSHGTIFYIIAGFFAGIMLGTGTATLLELSNATVRAKDQLEAISGVNVINRIPQLKKG